MARTDDFPAQLFAFLAGDDEEFRLVGGKILTREAARQLLQELIPAEIEVRGVCTRSISAVAAAPHVSFDNWSEYFCNRTARTLGLGRVIATNFRDQDGLRIPVSIGRHIHVNRPFESNGPGKPERETERARRVHEQYLAALRQASGRAGLPMDLLVEFHSHRRTPFLEIATVGLTSDLAHELAGVYRSRRVRTPLLPELRIEPLDELQLRAESAKTNGSLRPAVATCGLHVEIPRETRREETFRAAGSAALIELLSLLLERMEGDDRPS
ncbi:MAG: hypothetical protein PHI18_07535 [bacterium]|nr:hypothetical protein [bacterium]